MTLMWPAVSSISAGQHTFNRRNAVKKKKSNNVITKLTVSAIHIGSFVFSFLLLVVLSIDYSAALHSMHSCNKDLRFKTPVLKPA